MGGARGNFSQGNVLYERRTFKKGGENIILIIEITGDTSRLHY